MIQKVIKAFRVSLSLYYWFRVSHCLFHYLCIACLKAPNYPEHCLERHKRSSEVRTDTENNNEKQNRDRKLSAGSFFPDRSSGGRFKMNNLLFSSDFFFESWTALSQQNEILSLGLWAGVCICVCVYRCVGGCVCACVREKERGEVEKVGFDIVMVLSQLKKCDRMRKRSRNFIKKWKGSQRKSEYGW